MSTTAISGTSTPFTWDRARRIFLAWELLRFAYNAPLVLLTIGGCLLCSYDTGFLEYAVKGGIAVNLCYFAGPAAELYIAVSGFQHWILRIVLWAAGLGIALFLAGLVLLHCMWRTF